MFIYLNNLFLLPPLIISYTFVSIPSSCIRTALYFTITTYQKLNISVSVLSLCVRTAFYFTVTADHKPNISVTLSPCIQTPSCFTLLSDHNPYISVFIRPSKQPPPSLNLDHKLNISPFWFEGSPLSLPYIIVSSSKGGQG